LQRRSLSDVLVLVLVLVLDVELVLGLLFGPVIELVRGVARS